MSMDFKKNYYINMQINENMQREKNLQRRSDSRNTIQQRRYEAMSANKMAKDETIQQIRDAKSMENLRLSAQLEQKKVDKLKQLIARNKAKQMYDANFPVLPLPQARRETPSRKIENAKRAMSASSYDRSP